MKVKRKKANSLVVNGELSYQSFTLDFDEDEEVNFDGHHGQHHQEECPVGQVEELDFDLSIYESFGREDEDEEEESSQEVKEKLSSEVDLPSGATRVVPQEEEEVTQRSNLDSIQATTPSTTSTSTGWTTGIRQLSLSSDCLNERMAKRGILNKNQRSSVCSTGKSDQCPAPLSSSTRLWIQDQGFDYNSGFYFGKDSAGKVRKSPVSEARQSSSVGRIFTIEEKDVDDDHCCGQEKNEMTNKKMNLTSSTGHPMPRKPSLKIDGFCTKTGSVVKISDNVTAVSLPACTTRGLDSTSVHFVDLNCSSCTNKGNNDAQNAQKSGHKWTKHHQLGFGLGLGNGQLEIQRLKRQYWTELWSLFVIIFAIGLLLTSPFLLIPISVYPNQYSNYFAILLWFCTGFSLVCLVSGSILGNMVWYFDQEEIRWKWRLHCGQGPEGHYWGSALCPSKKKDISSNSGQVLKV